MGDHKVEKLSNLTDDQVSQLADMCIRAYPMDRLTQFLLMGDGSDSTLSLDEVLPIYWTAVIKCGEADGNLYGIRNEKGDVVSFALWFEPGKRAFATKPQQETSAYKKFFMETMPPSAHKFGGESMPLVGKNRAKFWSEDEINNKLWWCSAFATDPEYQGKGYGRAVLGCVTKELSEKGMLWGVTASYEPNVKIYEKLGFRLLNTEIIPCPDGGTTPAFIMGKTS